MSAAALPVVDTRAAGLDVRDDLREAHASLLDALRRPGAWLDGAERRAIAEESRGAGRCGLCRERRAALSPEHVRGEHDRASDAPLPDALVELAHRVRSDSGRLSRAWHERVRAGTDDGRYVETVGIVALLAGLDAFCRALGIPRYPLPPPAPGEPTRRRPEGLVGGVAWVPMLPPEAASGPEADLYPPVRFVPNIIRALSLVPDQVRMLVRFMRSHYLPAEQMGDPSAGRALDRLQIELIAARVSALNECFY